MTSPSFDVVAKVPSPPRHDQTRATDRNKPIRSEAVRVTRERDQARAAAIEAGLEQVAETYNGQASSIPVEFIYCVRAHGFPNYPRD